MKNGAARVGWQLVEEGAVPTTLRTPEPVLILPQLPEIWRSGAWVRGTHPLGLRGLSPALQDPREAPGGSLPPRAVASLLSTFSPSKSIFISNYKRQSQSR